MSPVRLLRAAAEPNDRNGFPRERKIALKKLLSTAPKEAGWRMLLCARRSKWKSG
jgi:hypothetical protein